METARIRHGAIRHPPRASPQAGVNVAERKSSPCPESHGIPIIVHKRSWCDILRWSDSNFHKERKRSKKKEKKEKAEGEACGNCRNYGNPLKNADSHSCLEKPSKNGSAFPQLQQARRRLTKQTGPEEKKNGRPVETAVTVGILQDRISTVTWKAQNAFHSSHRPDGDEPPTSKTGHFICYKNRTFSLATDSRFNPRSPDEAGF